MKPAHQTVKRRKMARIPSDDGGCASIMEHLDINAAPLGNVSDSPIPERRRRLSRNSSGSSSISTSSENTSTTSTSSENTSTTRRVSNVPKQPLGLDLTYGNSPSTVRHFKRVSSGERRAALHSNPPANINQFHPNPNAKTFRPLPSESMHQLDSNDENAPPGPVLSPTSVTKEALYGRRAYSKAMDSVFQEAYANSASAHQRDALGGVHQAWAHLDQVDPQGEFLLMKAMIDRLQGDSKLASALGIAISPTPSSTPKRTPKSSETSLSGSTVHGTSTTRIRSSTTSTSVSSYHKSSGECTSTPQQSRLHTPITTPTSPIKGPKLLLAQNNPQPNSHRRRQSAVVGGERPSALDGYGGLDKKKLPGHVEPGMEQQGLLSDILYEQWVQGLRSRWPVA
jgi:serine/threonine-protein kinase 24/25/MST4